MASPWGNIAAPAALSLSCRSWSWQLCTEELARLVSFGLESRAEKFSMVITCQECSYGPATMQVLKCSVSSAMLGMCRNVEVRASHIVTTKYLKKAHCHFPWSSFGAASKLSTAGLFEGEASECPSYAHVTLLGT